MARVDWPGAINELGVAKNQTLRQRVRISAGGHRLRVRFSNEFGTKPLFIGSASVGLSASGADIKAGSLRPLTFGGSVSSVVPAGSPALSDSVDIDVGSLGELTISLFLPEEVALETVHYVDLQDNCLSANGDFTQQEVMPVMSQTATRAFLTGVEIMAVKGTRVIVALGDSITDGGSDTRWPDKLAERLNVSKKTPAAAVVNAGIGGNQVLGDGAGVSALARFDRDVLAVPGVSDVVLLEGINDIGASGMTFQGKTFEVRSADDLISGYKQLIARAHVRGLKIYGATLLPFEGKTADSGYYSPVKDEVRRSINAWIRTSGAFDGVIDFDRVMRDPKSPGRLRQPYDSGDNLHPGEAGYKAMSESIDLKLFK